MKSDGGSKIRENITAIREEYQEKEKNKRKNWRGMKIKKMSSIIRRGQEKKTTTKKWRNTRDKEEKTP